MKFKNPLLCVKDLDASKRFYCDVLGLRVTADFGANVTLTGGVCLQTEETWKEFIRKENIVYGNSAEVYFEEDDFDSFVKKLASKSVEYVHEVFEHRWGQRVVRFYDPDGHIIEVGENMGTVCRRFFDEGMNESQIAERMEVPFILVRKNLEKRK